MTFTKSTDHVKRGVAKFIQQYKNKPRLTALLRSYLNRIQAVEDALWEVIQARLLVNAEGIQLDTIGKIIGRGRNSLSDSDYKIAITGQIRINRSCGTPEDMISVAGFSVSPPNTFTYDEVYPATIIMTFLGLTASVSVLFDNLIRTKSGGVRLFLIWSPMPSANTFTFAPGSTPVASTTNGFADGADPGTGGYLASVLGG